MNYVIISEMRTGSSFLGEFLQLQGLPYYNELFTTEICRRSNIMPIDADEAISAFALDQVWERPDAGFKMIYGQATPGVWSRLALAHHVKVIHLFRDDMLEQFCSGLYLKHVGVSCNRDGELWGTDGKVAQADLDFKIHIDPLDFSQWCHQSLWFRQFVDWSFKHNHQVIDIPFLEVFNPDRLRTVLEFLQPGRKLKDESIPDHNPTPRPKAREMIRNYDELAEHFSGTNYERFFKWNSHNS